MGMEPEGKPLNGGESLNGFATNGWPREFLSKSDFTDAHLVLIQEINEFQFR
jgi:hypothetical protein